MNTGTELILERIKKGNSSAKTRITVDHFADLFRDLDSMGREGLLNAIREEFQARRASRTAKPKGEFEILVGDVRVRTSMKTREILTEAYSILHRELGERTPARSKVRSIAGFSRHFEPLVGMEKMKKAVLGAAARRGSAH